MGNASGREAGPDGTDADNGSNGDINRSAMMSSSSPDTAPSDSMAIGNSGEINHVATSPISHGRSTTPLLFAPQVPLSPLPMSNGPAFPSWQSDNQGNLEGGKEQGIPNIITWNHGGNNVAIEGSWDNWATRNQMQKCGKDYSILMVLQSGIYHYKFIVDGECKYSPDLPYQIDEMGQVCNVLDVNDYVPENPESVSEFELPASPEASYSQAFPSEEDFAKEPLGVPPQLHLTMLDVEESHSSSKPQHVVLNHLFIEKGWASQSLLALGMTHRYQSKYVTVVLYKPLRR